MLPGCGLVALLRLPGLTGRGVQRVRLLLDALVVASSLLVLVWLSPAAAAVEAATGPVAQGLTFAMPALDVLAVSVAVVVLDRLRSRPGPAVVLACLALAATCTSEAVYVAAAAAGAYQVGGLPDLSWCAGFALLVVAAGVPERAPAPEPDAVEGLRLLPLLPAVAATGALALTGRLSTGLDHVLTVCLVVLGASLVLRQYLLHGENTALHRSLEATVTARTRQLSEAHERERLRARTDELTGLANRPALLSAIAEAVVEAGGRGRGRGRRLVRRRRPARPRRLQGRQRRARPRPRRQRPGGRRLAPARRAAARRAGPARRRRVRLRADRAGRAAGGRTGRPAPRRGPVRAAGRGRPRRRPGRERGRGRGPAERRAHAARPPSRGGHRDVRRQARGRPRRPRLRPADARRCAVSRRGRERAARRGARGAGRPALPAGAAAGDRADRRRRGAGALAPARVRAGAPGRVHPGRRADRPDRPARAPPARPGLPADRGVAPGQPRAQVRRQPLPAAPARAGRGGGGARHRRPPRARPVGDHRRGDRGPVLLRRGATSRASCSSSPTPASPWRSTTSAPAGRPCPGSPVTRSGC